METNCLTKGDKMYHLLIKVIHFFNPKRNILNYLLYTKKFYTL